MKLFTLVSLIGILSVSLVGSIDDDEPTGHPLRSDIAPVAEFGMRYHPILEIRRMHAGVDFLAEEGTPVYATADGTVKVAKENNGLGKHIALQHKSGYETVYGHLSEIGVTLGDEIKKGEQIGLVGNTGLSQEPHLHYEIRDEDRKPLNPADFLP